MKRKLLDADTSGPKKRKLTEETDVEKSLFDLGVKKNLDQARQTIEKADNDQRLALKKAFLKGTASKGWMGIGLKYLAAEQKENRRPLFKFFILQLVNYHYVTRVKNYVEKNRRISIKNRSELRRFFLTALAENENVDKAETYLKKIEGINLRFNLRKYFISQLVNARHIESAKTYVGKLQQIEEKKAHRFSFYIRLIREFTKHQFFDETKELLLMHKGESQDRLFESFILIANPDLQHYTANLQLMVRMNDEVINDLIGKKILTLAPGVDVERMQKWAGKINAIMEKYKVNFTHAKNISELGEGNRYWIACRYSLFSKKNLPLEITDKITGYLLEQSNEDAEKIINAVETRHRSL
jgi:hypothetical protein